MVVRVIISLVLTFFIAVILWLVLTHRLIMGMNPYAPVIFWTIMVIVLMLDYWVANSIVSGKVKGTLLILLLLGILVPFVSTFVPRKEFKVTPTQTLYQDNNNSNK